MATFLSADVPLTKSYELRADRLIKTPYPHVRYFTSHDEPTNTISELYIALRRHAAQGHCYLKGDVQRELIQEPRAGSTDSTGATTTVVFDLDKMPLKNPHEFMKLVGLDDVSYIVQYSASMGIDPDAQLSAHIFVVLNAPFPAPILKAWLMHLNMAVPQFKEAIQLSRTGAALRWPLDITTCQNDKLIYIAPPQLTNLEDPYETNRFQLVHRDNAFLDINRIKCPSLEALKKDARHLLNELRKQSGMEIIRSQTKFINGCEVQQRPGEAIITGVKEERGFTYFNFNGGDSWGYYHPNDNYELIHNFKGEPAYLTKELIPAYYKDKLAEQQLANEALESKDGTLILAFRDFQSALYYNGTYDPKSYELNFAVAKTEKQLIDFMAHHGKNMPETVPIWNVIFDPRSEIIVDESNRVLNTYIPSPFYRMAKTKIDTVPPTIHMVIESAVGKGAIADHFINWLACIVQWPGEKAGTAWVLHGTQGTGKGVLFHEVLTPMFGHEYCVLKRAKELQEGFNGWAERALIAFIDEVKVPRSQFGEFVAEDIKTMITEPRLPIRHMYRPAFMAYNFTRFIFASNDPHPVTIQQGDRRFNVGDRQERRLFLTPKQIKDLRKEVSAFFQYLLHYPADIERARTIMHNESRELIIQNSRTSLDMVADALREGDFAVFWDAMPDAILSGASAMQDMIGMRYAEILQNIVLQRERTTRLHRDEIYILFTRCVGDMPSSPSKFTRLLGHHNIQVQPTKRNGQTIRGIDITWNFTEEWIEARRAELLAQNPKLKAA